MLSGIPQRDLAQLIRDKYDGDASRVTEEDRKRLAAGEPLAYVIGHIPFLGLSIHLAGKPLIPRPETEWWTEQLITHIQNTMIYHSESPARILDLCAGSGAVGLAIAKHCPNTHVSFGERVPEFHELIRTNARINEINEEQINVRTGDLFAPFENEHFDIIATNPPYIPDSRTLDASVVHYEPKEALRAGADGLSIIRRILKDAPDHLLPNGKLWMECDIENIEEAARLARALGAHETNIRTDQYGRPRLLVGYYP